METKREKSLKIIAEKFSTLENFVTLQNKSGFSDINKSAERLFIDILNVTYNLTLRDMNEIQENYPAIDLGDYNKRICVQVTSESTNQKFRRTVEKFKEKKLDKDFDRIVFLIISNKNLCTLSDKEIETKVINLTDLYKNISTLNDRNISYIENYLTQNLVSHAEKNNSILPTNLFQTYNTSKPDALIRFLRFENDHEATQELSHDLKKLSKIISSLTQNQREYLFYTIAEGRFARKNGRHDYNVVVIPTSQVDQEFEEYGFQIFQVLKSKDLLFINDEYDPHNDDRYVRVIEPYFSDKLDGVNLFAAIKEFCGDDDSKLRRIFLECDFSCL